MPYLTKDEVVAMLKERRQREVINDHIITGTPYVFRASPTQYGAFQQNLSEQLRTPVKDITIIGSARIGFSLDPDKFGSPFNLSSDIDTIIVNAAMFDTAWAQIVKVGRRRLSWPYKVQNAFADHRNNNVFYGFFEPDRLPGAITLANLWFRTFQRVGIICGLPARVFNGRLYRTWDHVMGHQLYSLEKIATDEKVGG